jgi:hypothetical protein
MRNPHGYAVMGAGDAGNAHRVRTSGACLDKSPAQATGLTASGDRRATIVPAGAEHQFAGYEGLAVLVIFERQLG